MKFFVSCQNVSLEKHDNVCITKLYECLIKTFLKTWLFLQKILWRSINAKSILYNFFYSIQNIFVYLTEQYNLFNTVHSIYFIRNLFRMIYSTHFCLFNTGC